MSFLDSTLDLVRKGSDVATKAAEEAKKGRQVFDTFSDLVGDAGPTASAPTSAPVMSQAAPGLVESPLTRYVGLGVGLLALVIIAVLAWKE